MPKKPVKTNLKKIFLIAGSTGGHAMPIFSISEELDKLGYKQKIFVSGSEIEREIFKSKNTVKILSGRFNRYNKLKNITGSILIILGIVESFFYLLFNRPNLIFSKGGFLAVPVLYAARLLNIPYFTHESDSEIGLTNKIFHKKAKKFFVGFPLELYKNITSKNIIYAGQIVEKNYLEAKINNQNSKPTIFITGGSQGSRKINNIIEKILPTLLRKYLVIHQIGRNDIEKIENSLRERVSEDLLKNYHSFTFSIEENFKAFIDSDLIIGRAGANTIGEIAALARASILIPYPYAASDHQTKNARYLEKVQGAIVIKEENLNEKSLLERIDYLMNNKKNLEVIGRNAKLAVKFDGLLEIIKAIKNYLEE